MATAVRKGSSIAYWAMDETRQKELLEKNLAAWEGELFEPKSQDSSLKKNSAFVKKLTKGINKEQCDAIMKEMATLSLKKYHAELLLAVEEGLLKTKTHDTPAAVEIISMMHQRFCPDFTPMLLTWFYEQLESPIGDSLDAKEDKDHISKVKVLLRLLTVLVGVGVFHSIDDTPDQPNWVFSRKKNSGSIIVIVLKEILAYKLRTGVTLSVALTFTKRFSTLVQEDAAVRQVLKTYTEAVIARTIQLHTKLKEVSLRKHKAQIRTGRILEELEAEYNELTELFVSFKAATEALGPLFGLDMPELESTDVDANLGDSIIVNKDAAFQNDEEKRFYQSFPEIPQELIDASNADAADISKAEEMNEFLIELETVSTIKEIDECVMNFWKLKLSNKASKNRLLKHFITSKETGKCKVYSRFIRSNVPYLDDIKEELISYLDQGFRSQIHHNHLNFKNILFFCEMMKFELIPEHVSFHKIRSLIMNLAIPNNIEILTVFFEISGKYLLNEHNQLMEEMLVLLEKKRKTDKLTINNKMAISNLFLLLKPPSIKTLQSQVKQYTPEQLFFKEMIRNELNTTNVKAVRKIINTANLQDPVHWDTMMKLFTKPDKLRYENIIALATVLKTMSRNFKIAVVDTILENIVRAMEVNDYRFNRIRMAQCFYIGQIYEQGIIGVMVIHDLIFKILTFGHPNNSPNPIKLAELDQPDEYFRIQMVCLLLQNCSFEQDKMKDRLDVLLHFFDYYIWIKDQPIPKESDFKVVNCFAKYKYQRAPGVKEAVESLSEVVKAKGMTNGSVDDEDDEDDDEEEDDDDEDDNDDDDDGSDQSDSDDEVLDADLTMPLSITDESDVSPDQNKLSYEAYERKLQEEEEKRIEEQLEKEFKKLVFESMHSQRNSKTTVELPESVNVRANDENVENFEKPKGISTAGGKVQFKLVTRKGKGVSVRDLNVPQDVRFATNVVAEEKRTRLEKDKLTKFILNSRYDD